MVRSLYYPWYIRDRSCRYTSKLKDTAASASAAATAAAEPLETHIHVNEVVETMTETLTQYVTCILPAVTTTVTAAATTIAAIPEESATAAWATVTPKAGDTKDSTFSTPTLVSMWVFTLIFLGLAVHDLWVFQQTKRKEKKKQEQEEKQERWKEAMRKRGVGQWHKVDLEPKPVQTRNRRVHFESESDHEEESWELNL